MPSILRQVPLKQSPDFAIINVGRIKSPLSFAARIPVTPFSHSALHSTNARLCTISSYLMSTSASAYISPDSSFLLVLSTSIFLIISSMRVLFDDVSNSYARYASPIRPAALMRGEILKAISPAVGLTRFCDASKLLRPIFFVFSMRFKPIWTIRRFSSNRGTRSAIVATLHKSIYWYIVSTPESA